ncbi:MAG: neutral/alkaline non-lysosomal ceramidase N-terminal domain-containing protein [Aureliella sp.]
MRSCIALFAFSLAVTLWVVSGTASSAGTAEGTWRAGVATVDVTPSESMWMAGFASRKAPSAGVTSRLFVKVLALEDANKHRAVMVTSDLIGIPQALREQVAAACASQHHLDPNGLLMNCSHTHSGPVVRDKIEMSVMYPLEPEQRQRVESYFIDLREKIVKAIGQAIETLEPAQLSYSHARCGFAMNRRLPTATGLQNSPYPNGPVDHDVPVLRVESSDGKLRAIAFGYACHNTTLSASFFDADYAGYAQSEIEKEHPGTVALFVMGCGGDQNPYPRGKLELAQTHGKSLATSVEAALLPAPKPVSGSLRFAYREVELPFAPLTRDEILLRQQSTDAYERRRGEALLEEWDKHGRVRESYPYPIQVLQLGDGLTLVALGGEVVVDYALRLKRELSDTSVWLAGYSNDVMAYIPSDRVLSEGGYEGGGAMRYSNLPNPWRPGVEERIIAAVHEMVGDVRRQ